METPLSTQNWEQPAHMPPGFHVPRWEIPTGVPLRSPLERTAASFVTGSSSPQRSYQSTSTIAESQRPPRNNQEPNGFCTHESKRPFMDNHWENEVRPIKRGFFLNMKKRIAIKILKLVLEQLTTIIALLDE